MSIKIRIVGAIKWGQLNLVGILVLLIAFAVARAATTDRARDIDLAAAI
jgi:hypothetical protein